jgi:hypothetical protein
MQKPLQLLVTGRVMRRIHRLVILAEELGVLTLRQVAENHLRVVRILNLDRLGGHASKLHLGPDATARLSYGNSQRDQTILPPGLPGPSGG